jgi:hypothetical protein
MGWFMKRITITHLLLFVTWCAILFVWLSRYFATAPYQGTTNDLSGMFSYYGLGETTSTTIDEEVVTRSPVWHPADSNPPVSARSALSIAERFRRERLHDKNNWKWGLESLTLYPIDGKHNKWCWCVLFTAYPEVGGMGGMPPEFSAYVLMNGEVVTPETESNDLFEEQEILEETETERAPSTK